MNTSARELIDLHDLTSSSTAMCDLSTLRLRSDGDLLTAEPRAWFAGGHLPSTDGEKIIGFFAAHHAELCEAAILLCTQKLKITGPGTAEGIWPHAGQTVYFTAANPIRPRKLDPAESS